MIEGSWFHIILFIMAYYDVCFELFLFIKRSGGMVVKACLPVVVACWEGVSNVSLQGLEGLSPPPVCSV